MAWRYLLDSASRATAGAAFMGLALLALPAACGSASGEADEEAPEPSASPDPIPVPPRPPASESEPDPSENDVEAPENPALAPQTPPDAPPAAPGAGAGSSNGVSPVAAATFASCTRSEGVYGTNCDYVYVSMRQASPARCVQLTIDNCGDPYSRQGLSVDTPITWQLSSASIGPSPDDCELGVFYPASDIVVGASGDIGWDAVESTELPTAIVVDVTLRPSTTADDPTSVDVVTPEPLNPVRCAD